MSFSIQTGERFGRVGRSQNNGHRSCGELPVGGVGRGPPRFLVGRCAGFNCWRGALNGPSPILYNDAGLGKPKTPVPHPQRAPILFPVTPAAPALLRRTAKEVARRNGRDSHHSIERFQPSRGTPFTVVHARRNPSARLAFVGHGSRPSGPLPVSGTFGTAPPISGTRVGKMATRTSD